MKQHRLDKERTFLAFGKLLHMITTSGMSKQEIRNWIVKNSETDDILVLVDVLDDLLKRSV